MTWPAALQFARTSKKKSWRRASAYIAADRSSTGALFRGKSPAPGNLRLIWQNSLEVELKPPLDEWHIVSAPVGPSMLRQPLLTPAPFRLNFAVESGSTPPMYSQSPGKHTPILMDREGEEHLFWRRTNFADAPSRHGLGAVASCPDKTARTRYQKT